MSVLIQTASSLFVSTCTTGIEMKSHDGVSLDRPVFQRGMPVCVPPAVVRSTSSCRPAMPTVGDLARWVVTWLGNTTVYVGVTIFAKRLDFFRLHVIRTETCLTLLCRVHRCLLKSAITVCLMGHTAVQTSVAQRVCFHLSRATQSATLSSASICRRMMCCQVERMTKDMTASV